MPLLQVVEEMHSLLQLVLQHKQEQKMPLEAIMPHLVLLEEQQEKTNQQHQR
jgi:hypothetical protein